MKLTLRAARVNTELTQEQVAEITGHTVQTISNWEKGKTVPKAKDLLKLAEIYKVQPSDFSLPESLS